MSRSLVKFAAIILVIAALCYVGLYGVDFTDTVRIPGVTDSDGITQGLDLKGGTVIVFKADATEPAEEDMETAMSMLRKRLDFQGYTEADVTIQGSNKIRVELPDVQDSEKAVETLGATAQLEFKDADGNVIMNGDQVKEAKAEYGQTSQGISKNQYYISMSFTEEGQKKFSEATKEAAAQSGSGKNYIEISMDGNTLTMPSVKQQIDSDSCVIEGEFTAEEAKSLAANISSGRLPFSLKTDEVKVVSATLGEEALTKAITAGVIGLILVMLFMLLIYRLLGLMADIALMFYVAVVLICISVLHVNLTLPGIAGIILAIGMAVDANVVIFERVKEELKLGKTVRSAVDAGFNRALSAVIDSNVTTIISAAILWWLGTGTIKGFGITLLLGVVISMISAIFVTKFLLKQMIGMNVKAPWLYGINQKKTGAESVKGGEA